MARFFSLLLTLSLVALHAPISSNAQSPDFTELDKVLTDEMLQTKTPGVSIAIVKGDRIVYSKCFGLANNDTGATVTPDMLFQIGSVTKMFTAALAVSLAEEGKVKLDAPVGDYVKGLAPKLSQITLHQLLTHTSGLKDEPAEYGPHDESALADYPRTWKDEYRMLEPGRIFSYSNLGFSLAGLVAQTAGGKPYAELMSDRLFKPLGMKSASIRPTMAMTWPLASGHRTRGKTKPEVVRPMADDARHWPAGFIYSNALDLAQFAIAFLNSGRVEGQQALSPSLIAKLSTPYTDVPNLFENAKYGYGLILENYRGVATVWHDGAMPGFSAVLRMAPRERVAAIILSNNEGVELTKTMDKALELMLALKPQTKPAEKTLQQMTESEMKRYEGSYSNRWTMKIFIRDGRLFLDFFGQELPVTKIGENRFSATPRGATQPEEFLIGAGADGRAEFMHLFLWAFRRNP